MLYIGCGPLPVAVTARIITFLVGNPYKPLFATVTGKGPHSSYKYIYIYSPTCEQSLLVCDVVGDAADGSELLHLRSLKF